MTSDKEKSTTQSAFDKTRRQKDHEVHGGTSESVIDKVKNAVGMGTDNSPAQRKQV